MEFLTPELFDTLVIVFLIIGLILAVARFYRDMTRPLPPRFGSLRPVSQDDTQPGRSSRADSTGVESTPED